MKLFLLCLLVTLAACEEELGDRRKTYEGYQVFDALPRTQTDVQFLRKLMISTDWLDFWQEPSRSMSNVTVMVGPSHVRQLENLLSQHHIPFARTLDNVASIVKPVLDDIDARSSQKKVFDINDFNTLSDINSWVLQLTTQCRPGLACQVYSIGNSHNGNSILVFRIFQAGSNRRAYWIDSTIHAREWLAPATVLKVLDALVRGTSASAIQLTNDFDWYILPVMNPDGYDYTWTNERLWRKNRRPNTGSPCIGTDLNRNFNFRWGTDGVSHLPCSDIYCGPSGGSEPETHWVQNELVRLGSSVLAAVTVHSYGNMWMFPWGNTVNHAGQVCQRAADHADLMFVADRTANAIQATYGTNWARGNSCEVIYETSGGTDDYAKGIAGIKYTFCPELRGNSFIIPAAQIENSFNEFFNGIITMANTIATKG